MRGIAGLCLACLLVSNNGPAYTATEAHIEPTRGDHHLEDSIPFGLEQLHWSMRAQEANSIVPDRLRSSFVYRTCRFAIYLTFTRDRLSAVNLLAVKKSAPESCRKRVERDLVAQYGKPQKPISTNVLFFGARHGDWRKKKTQVTYNSFQGRGRKVEIMFQSVSALR